MIFKGEQRRGKRKKYAKYLKVRPENHHRSKQKSRQLPGCHLGPEHGKFQAVLQNIKHPTLCT